MLRLPRLHLCVHCDVIVTQSCSTLCSHWTVALQGSSVHGILQQEYWSGLPFPSPRDLPDPWIKPMFPTLQTDSWPSEPPGKPIHVSILCQNLFPFRLLHDEEQSSLCYTVSPSWLSILRQWHPTPVLLPGKSHGRRSLVGCSLWGR